MSRRTALALLLAVMLTGVAATAWHSTSPDNRPRSLVSFSESVEEAEIDLAPTATVPVAFLPAIGLALMLVLLGAIRLPVALSPARSHEWAGSRSRPSPPLIHETAEALRPPAGAHRRLPDQCRSGVPPEVQEVSSVDFRILLPLAVSPFAAGNLRDRRWWRALPSAGLDPEAASQRKRLPRVMLRAQVEDGARLEDLDLERSDLAGCLLDDHDFSHLSMFKSKLSRATMRNCRMVATDLSFAKLREADLRAADLRAANLLEADLGRADLRGANLSSARHLSSAVLRGARFDRTTRFPVGFDPEVAGAKRITRT